MAEFRLIDLYRTVFGYVAPPYPLAGIPDPRNLLPIKELPRLDDIGITATIATSPVRGSVPDVGGLGNEIRMPISVGIPGEPLFKLPNEPIVSFRARKDFKITNLSRTRELGGKRFTVKEETRIEDYRISIKGIAYNEDTDDYPEADIRQIRRIVEHPGSIVVEGYLFGVLNISQLSVFDFSFPRNDQAPFRLQAYEIEALSDDNFELEIN